MLIVTNRKINENKFICGIGNEESFSECLNAKGSNEVRLAHANKIDGKWEVKLVEEPAAITKENIPSKGEFDRFRMELIRNRRNCVFFVHGFNQSFRKNIEKALMIEKIYNVEVIAFSWPSNPGGFKFQEYRYAKRASIASNVALDSTLEKLGKYLKEPFSHTALQNCNIKFSLMAHSMGNYLLQNYVSNSMYESETQIFDNVILCQADVDSEGHAHWVDMIEPGKRIYITINENDWALKWSDLNFQKARLGRTARDLNSTKAIYFDFTDGPNIESTHGIFYKDTNSVVKSFFEAVLNGKPGENIEGMKYNHKKNAYSF